MHRNKRASEIAAGLNKDKAELFKVALNKAPVLDIVSRTQPPDAYLTTHYQFV